MTTADQVLYNDGNVFVTTTMLSVGSASYPIAGISSYYVSAVKGSAVGWMLGAIVGALYTVATLVGATETPALILLTLLLGALTYFCGGKRALHRPETFSLFLRTAGGDLQAVSSREVGTIRAVESALRKAITVRG